MGGSCGKGLSPLWSPPRQRQRVAAGCARGGPGSVRCALQCCSQTLHRFLSLTVTVAFCDLLLHAAFLLLFLLLLPVFVLHDHVLPALLALLRAMLPVADVFLNGLLLALAAFLTALFPPTLILLCGTQLLLLLAAQALALLW